MNSLGFDKPEKDTKVVVAMSGGVDSSVAAVKLKREGYDVIGVTLKLYNQSDISKSKSCCAGRDIEDAKRVAEKYNFSHIVLDFQDKFFEGVIDNFIESYSNAETPVPCIRCNQTVKFRDLLIESKNLKADALVTGHYAIREGGLEDAKLFKASDNKKDQSYFLFATNQEQLNYIRFPLGHYLKSEIRQMAIDFDLEVSDKPDSQDICFVTSSSYRDLINKINPELNKSGNIFDYEGNIIGKHSGITNYTVGQRKGVGVGGQKTPLYVIEVNKEQNYLVLGNESKLKKSKIIFKDINWLGSGFEKKNLRCSAKIRSTQKEIEGVLNIEKNQGTFVFDEPLNSTAPGQACVFYKENRVLGGGWITKN